ncbi:MAG: response regulator [Planctomycetes bacterium]|nr:response regulator [Planctomycetota bacterium]
MSLPPSVLLIEDRESNIYLCRYILERSGFRVLAARTGREGVERARAERPDLILLDLQMPEQDGFTTAADLRSFPETRDTPIVALTACVLPAEKDQALAAGCRGFIEKPIRVSEFAREVSSYLPTK